MTRNEQSIIQDLERLKETIEDTKTTKAQAEGKLESSLERLKQDFHLDSVEAAEKRVEDLKYEESSLEEQLIKRYNMLKEKYTW